MSDDLSTPVESQTRSSVVRPPVVPRPEDLSAPEPPQSTTDGGRRPDAPRTHRMGLVRRRTVRRVVRNDVDRPGRPRMPWNRTDAIVAFVFLVGGYVVTSQMWRDPFGHTTAANGTDQTFFEWMLVHGLRVFTHGDNPLFAKQLNAPLGVNLMSNTGLLGLSLPFAPVTALFGAGPTFVLLIMLGLAGTAFAWYYVMSRHFVGGRLAGFVGGTVCGFGPGIVTHANAHPNLTAGFLVPLILWRALALRGSRRPVRDGLILGALATYQVFINEEVLFLTALAGTLFVLIYLAFRPAAARGAAAPVVTGLATAGVLGAVLVAYPLYFQFYGPQHFSGLPTWLEGWPYRLPLQSYVTLPELSHFGNPAANLKLATQTEENSFLGWPLVLVSIGIMIALWRRRPEVRALGIIGVLFAWASLGNAVVFRDPNHSHPALSLWRYLSNRALFDSVLPSRLAMVVLPIVGLLVAFAVRECLPVLQNVDGQQSFRVGAAVAAMAAVVASIILVLPRSVPVAPLPTTPRFFTSGDWRSYVPAGSSVMSASPYEDSSIPYMRWALDAGLEFSVPGGYFLGPDGKPKHGDPSQQVGQYGPQLRTTEQVMGSIGIGTWALPSDTSYWTTQAICDFRFWHTSIVVLDTTAARATDIRSSMDRLIGSGRTVDDVVLWDVRWTWDTPVTCPKT
ncbi:MAG TPA: hypothetical protein VKB59_21910 [Micromonosporaceae bacterium]|nr:hypothetical protein [Micromonosporaceae bacterium]